MNNVKLDKLSERMRKDIEEYINILHREYSSLESDYKKLQDLSAPSVMKVEPIVCKWNWNKERYVSKSSLLGVLPEFSHSLWGYYPAKMIYSSDVQIRNIMNEINSEYEKELSRVTSIHERNLPAIENNLKVRASIETFMKSVGIANTYESYELPTPRSRNKKNVTKRSGWVDDTNRVVIVYDSFDYQCEQMKKSRDSVIAIGEMILKEIERHNEKQKKVSKKKMEERKFTLISEKYFPGALDVEPQTIIDEIIENHTDKYYKLATAMMETRNDWSDGFYRVHNELSEFSVVNETDSDIVDCISKILNSGETDGRVFRDCKWSYDEIFGITEISGVVSDELDFLESYKDL